jgi:hypothetical protein
VIDMLVRFFGRGRRAVLSSGTPVLPDRDRLPSPFGRTQDLVLLTAWGDREIFDFKLRGTMLGTVLKH